MQHPSLPEPGHYIDILETDRLYVKIQYNRNSIDERDEITTCLANDVKSYTLADHAVIPQTDVRHARRQALASLDYYLTTLRQEIKYGVIKTITHAKDN